ncbi:hypothetical protein PJO47_29305, partial [Mycobacterium kansasii]
HSRVQIRIITYTYDHIFRRKGKDDSNPFIGRVWQAMGWAFTRGDHITKEHLFVYWLAPVEATLLAVWTFKLLVQPHKKQKQLEEEKVA